MGSINQQTVINGVLNAIIAFFIIDIILRQAINRLDVTARLRIDSLSGSIRPCIRRLNRIFKARVCTQDDLRQIVVLVDNIKPLPPKDIKELADKIDLCANYSEAKYYLDQLALQLSALFKDEKHFISHYVGLFNSMKSPVGLSVFIAIAYYSLPLLIIPASICYLNNLASGWIVIAAFIIFIGYEFMTRKSIRK